MAAPISLNGTILHKNPSTPTAAAAAAAISARHAPHHRTTLQSRRRRRCWGAATTLPLLRLRATAPPPPEAGSRADDSSAPFEMSVESALKLLGVSEGASFDDILRAKNAVLASCKDDQEAVAQVEAAYDMLLMQSLSQRRAGKVVNNRILYADVKPVRSAGAGAMPKWLQTTVKNVPVSVEAPSTGNLGVQAGVYGALMVFTFVNGTSTSSAGTYTGADVPGIILATSFGASLYFLTKKSISLGKATIIAVGGLAVGAVVGSVVEKWLQVDIVPFFGIHSPAVIVSEFILFSQLLVSLYLR
ncbi:protein CHAPERONE-LIKE PROTEIN OF POR1, chloroplastic-like [Phoenix dactylifera]|uniref:Protein CHAPERONE-LIKE PROTEIN OF POR1, chloroplastic-like n=1 Tax=Phoenix dactylifera TaxID=42345 RepID=A0A8B7BTI0_PHODC|nr:protein CHAPERONE-LIKE PROTEIN OF POR1, chloroplastic-like [Phoenix dactylifera]XP_038977892.1 protein CHAPERONE-LIKE PROTEIN OF POR1, chloroplastic-like [Phoenix dactylifera]